MSHSAAIALPWGQETVGYFAKQPPRRLLVFVHGFGGAASATWKGSEAALMADPAAANCDLIFFGYRSLNSQPELSAGILRSFLDEAAGESAAWQRFSQQALGHDAARNYTEVLLIAHSLGAPVARRAVLDAISVNANWAPKVRLLLFAPAHLGAFLHKLRKELGPASSVLLTLTSLAKLKILSLDALEPGSDFLVQLLNDSKTLENQGWQPQIRAKEVIFGDGENVVMTQRFLNDPPPSVWVGHGHCSICRCDRTAPAIAEHLL